MSRNPEYHLNVGDLVEFGFGFADRNREPRYRGRIVHVHAGESISQKHYLVRVTRAKFGEYRDFWKFEMFARPQVVVPGFVRTYQKSGVATVFSHSVATLP
jgi:hypothetical protein